MELSSPVRGKVMAITESADPAFASKMMGEGIAADPVEGMAYAPCDGTVSLLFPANHAVGIRTEEGVECLIHIGIDTVTLNGEGFHPLIKAGDQVKKGQPVIAFDLEVLKEKNLNPQTMMMVPDMGNAVVTVYPDEQGDETKVAMMIELERL